LTAKINVKDTIMYYRCEINSCEKNEKKNLLEFCKIQKVLYFEKIDRNLFYMYYISDGNKEEGWMDVERKVVSELPSGSKRCSYNKFKTAIM
jgi:hypothetical protein